LGQDVPGPWPKPGEHDKQDGKKHFVDRQPVLPTKKGRRSAKRILQQAIFVPFNVGGTFLNPPEFVKSPTILVAGFLCVLNIRRVFWIEDGSPIKYRRILLSSKITMQKT
jgi:hypothetical protein